MWNVQEIRKLLDDFWRLVVDGWHITLDLKVMGLEGGKWNHLTQDRNMKRDFVYSAVNLWVSSRPVSSD
jgi:hypothetical protein